MIPLEGVGHLARLLFAQQRGADEIPPRVPPHLLQRTWRCVCECGHSWRLDHRDAEVRQNQVVAPRAECVACHRWVTGRLLDPL